MNFILFQVEAFVLGALLYILLRLNPWLGRVPLYLTVGILQYLQVILALGVYVEVYPGIVINGGSTVYFSGTLLSVLLIYIVDDASGARRLIYGLILANGILSLLTALVGLHYTSLNYRPFLEIPAEIFQLNPRVLMVGTVALFIDTLLIILLYELLHRLRSFALRIFLSLSVIQVLDSLMFVTGAFVEKPYYWDVLFANIIGKLMFIPAMVFALAMLHRTFGFSWPQNSTKLKDLFDLLTYREKYEVACHQSMRDYLSGLFNRRALDEMFPNTQQLRSGSVLLIDIDHFKSVNDTYGHIVGDNVIAGIAKEIQSSLREGDRAFRYGGDEFLVVLPTAHAQEADEVAQRIVAKIKHISIEAPQVASSHVTVTIGIAAVPVDGNDYTALIRRADERLLAGKALGRDQIMVPSTE
ncbi:GGDEF domain-containing protein [Amphritea sp. 1_MG-2023]|uniref:GGDEF domain-containing protein n=1 Tax=Amphritea sp. 1_MG-2023 TaxID=3062670 RepID=UPI0026E3D7C4|nr:GGDEF domain-containing protein [Amphritea sp. 1_MG-2023]MDO6561829.1 GGDEF domain-containing protein [Amphritea sp. 1_MG-2023]